VLNKPAKLFWNTTGGNLAETFEDIANELSNLRIVADGRRRSKR
jgi:hypothetical protein